jgi:hypothetical protein
MTGSQNDFRHLYSQYRLYPASNDNDRRIRRDRVRRARLLALAPALLGAAAAAEILTATKSAVVLGAVLAAACSVAALALVAGIVASASATSEAIRAGDEASAALARAEDLPPRAEAGDGDIADWVRRVEAALGQGEPGPDPPAAS